LDGNKLLDYFTDAFCRYIKTNPGSLGNLVESVYKRFEKFFSNNLVPHMKDLLEPLAIESQNILRDRLIKYARDKEDIFSYFKIGDEELAGVTVDQYKKLPDKKKEELKKKMNDAFGRKINDALDRIAKGKPSMGNVAKKNDSCGTKKETPEDKLANKLKDVVNKGFAEIKSLDLNRNLAVTNAVNQIKKIEQNIGKSYGNNAGGGGVVGFYPMPRGSKTAHIGGNKTKIMKHIMKRNKTLKNKLKL
jgi:hypothetical protein